MNNLTTTCETIGSTQTCVTDFSQGYFTSGELFIGLELFLILLILITACIRFWLNTFPKNKKFLGNNSTDGKEIYET